MVKYEMTEYLPLMQNKAGSTHLRVWLYYSLGGMNCFTGRAEPRGFYLSVTPMEKKGIMESFTAFTGLKALVLPVSRKSEKGFLKAQEEAKKLKQGLMLEVLSKNNLNLA